MAMRLYLTGLVISLTMCALLATPASAQLSSYVDEGGNVVFTNPNILTKAPASAKPKTLPDATPAAVRAQPISTVTAVPARPTPPAQLDTLVQQTAEKHHVDPNLVRAVISAESNWNASAVSRKGALGLMQLVPGTAQRLGVGNAFDPAQNVDAGTRYLGMLLERYNGDLSKALAAYNAGPGLVDRFGGVPNFPETRSYVQKVTANYFSPSFAPDLAPQAPPPIYRAVEADGRVVFTNE
jgi:soluble lytic murein transglycosylase-like protein